MLRAYSKIEIRSFDDDKREFSGIATTPTPDRYGDIVEPQGAEFSVPLPLLWQHRSDQPVGEIFSARPTAKGIPVRGRVFKATQSAKLIERLDEAWESIKLTLVKGLSIGFNPIEKTIMEDNYSFHFLRWDWLETSLVTIPANADASIQAIKSADRELRAALGQRRDVVYLDPSSRRVRRDGAIYLGPKHYEREQK